MEDSKGVRNLRRVERNGQKSEEAKKRNEEARNPFAKGASVFTVASNDKSQQSYKPFEDDSPGFLA